ncbi:hypothetical protein SDC9_181448 [bioreactor metagenome]|uniref:Uncharacterized protein n=1 Tax=bioreactor metagenome TaxID=1076179 RepID=A0A645H640_9ZZZZ
MVEIHRVGIGQHGLGDARLVVVILSAGQRVVQHGLHADDLVGLGPELRLVLAVPENLRQHGQGAEDHSALLVDALLGVAVLLPKAAHVGEHVDAAHVLPGKDAVKEFAVLVHRDAGGADVGDADGDDVLAVHAGFF